MNVHKHARMTVRGRVLLVQRVAMEGWQVAAAASAFGVSVRTAYKWLSRFRVGGEASLHDRSSAPARRPRATSPDRVATVEVLRRQRLSGPAISRRLGLPRSTVGAILRRIGLGRLSALDLRPPILRYEREHPGELIHVDIKKLGRIDGIGHRITGVRTGQSSKRGTGWECLHVAIDDASRLAYTEVLPDEKKQTTCGFARRAAAWFGRKGISIQRLMSDNGSAYRSYDFRNLLAELGIRHVRTRPYTPRTNGKAERFIQTCLREWAYATPYRSSQERTAQMSAFTDNYNLFRPHSALKGIAPFQKLNNLLGNDN
jgi:transposase InsO family protein